MSITLTTPIILTIAGVTETDTIGACTSLTQDFQGMTYTAVYKLGTALAGTPVALTQGPFSLANGYVLSVTFNLNTGVWFYTYAGTTGGGTLTGTPLTTLQTQFIAARNQCEAFVSVVGGLLPGTQVNWTAL
jgi:hypothetical protein